MLAQDTLRIVMSFFAQVDLFLYFPRVCKEWELELYKHVATQSCLFLHKFPNSIPLRVLRIFCNVETIVFDLRMCPKAQLLKQANNYVFIGDDPAHVPFPLAANISQKPFSRALSLEQSKHALARMRMLHSKFYNLDEYQTSISESEVSFFHPQYQKRASSHVVLSLKSAYERYNQSAKELLSIRNQLTWDERQELNCALASKSQSCLFALRYDLDTIHWVVKQWKSPLKLLVRYLALLKHFRLKEVADTLFVCTMIHVHN